MKKILLTCMLFSFALGGLLAQSTLSGKITDTKGLALIGANVVVVGQEDVGSITDFDGMYEFELPENATQIEISYTGYQTKKVDIEGRSTIDVILERGVTLDAAVVTALGVSRAEKSLGYAVEQISTEQMEKVVQTDAISALSGKVAGAQLKQSGNIGGSKQILIRGANSFVGNNNPLIVIDGLPVSNANYNSSATSGGNGGVDYGNMLNDLNMNDVASISVLKGAGAAIYGSRASNGVILITTKSASNKKDKFGVDFSTSFAFEKVYLMPELQTKYGGGATIADANGGKSGFEPVTIDGKEYLVPQYGVDESWGPRYNPEISVLPYYAFTTDYPERYLKPVPWVTPENDVRDFFQTGLSNTNSVSFYRQGDGYGVRAGFSNTNVKGVVPNSTLHKNNVSIKADYDISDKLNVNTYVNFTNNATIGRPTLGYPGGGQRYGNTLGQTLFQWTQRQIDYGIAKDYLNKDGSQISWNRNAWDDPTPHYSDNHYWSVYENYNDDNRDRLLGNIGLNYEIIEGLNLSGRMSGDVFSFANRERVAIGSQAQSSYYESIRNNSEYNFEAKALYNKRFNELLDFNAMIGANRLITKYTFNSGETSGGLVVPEVYNLNNSAGNVLSGDYNSEKQINSVFAQVGLGFKSLLYVDLTFRNDWSSTLPEDNNSYFYPGASLSFVFSELISDMPFLDYGKFRAGYSQVGNDTDPYRVINTYGFNSSGPYLGDPRLVNTRNLLNPDLRPELTTSIEFGVDLVFLKNRFGLNATTFFNNTKDQIIPLELSKSTGYDSKYINAGEIENNGIELGAFATPVKTQDFSWTLRANFTKVNNKVVSILEGVEAIDIATAPFSGVVLRASKGDTYGQFWGYDYIYDSDGNKVLGENGYYLRTKNIVPLGSVLPDFTMGITNELNYKNLSLSFLFDIQQGGKFYSVSHMWGHYSGVWGPTAGVNDKGNEIRDPVSEGGGIKLDGVQGTVTYDANGNYTVTDVKENDVYFSGKGWANRFYHGYVTPASQSLFDADYIKLRELSLAYMFDMNKSRIFKNIKVTVYGRNIWTFGLDYPGLDPEIAVAGSGNIQGIEGGSLPLTRSFGIKLDFGI